MARVYRGLSKIGYPHQSLRLKTLPKSRVAMDVRRAVSTTARSRDLYLFWYSRWSLLLSMAYVRYPLHLDHQEAVLGKSPLQIGVDGGLGIEEHLYSLNIMSWTWATFVRSDDASLSSAGLFDLVLIAYLILLAVHA
jgi:hypothetical protein